MNLLGFLQIYIIHIFCNVICIMRILNLRINDDICEYWLHFFFFGLISLAHSLGSFYFFRPLLKSTLKYQVKMLAYFADVKFLVIK